MKNLIGSAGLPMLNNIARFSMARILFYTSIKTRVKDQESLMVEFVRAGHKVFFLNQQPNKYLKEICERAGIEYKTKSYTGHPSTILFAAFHLFWFLRYVKRNKINVVYSHLEPANFIAVIGQFLLRIRIVIVRHHLDLAQRVGFQNDRSYKFTYSHAREIIAVSAAAKEFMISHESVAPEKIHHIDLGYDFDVFGKPDTINVEKIKKRHAGAIILISVGRFDVYKRMSLALQVCKALNDQGLQSHLYLLGEGEQHNELKKAVHDFGLESKVSLPGYVDNVLDYLDAADWLLHPSVSESSCVVIKEAGLVRLPVVVCNGVGDFDDYLINEKNSLVVDKDKFVAESVAKIKEYQTRSGDKKRLGEELYNTIVERFDIEKLKVRYDQFHKAV
jgi:glycosyltransferase involved in cell wall biosynthesis